MEINRDYLNKFLKFGIYSKPNIDYIKILKNKVDKYLDDIYFMLDVRKATKENKCSF
jgi:hypothetical protein